VAFVLKASYIYSQVLLAHQLVTDEPWVSAYPVRLFTVKSIKFTLIWHHIGKLL